MSGRKSELHRHLGFALAAVVLYLAFFSIDETAAGMEVGFFSPWTRITEGEFYFWFSSIFLLFPAGIFAGLAFEPLITPRFVRFTAWIRGKTARDWWLLVALTSALALLFYWTCHEVILLGMPITDDEYSARFGGQVLAMGKAMAPMPAVQDAFPHLFILKRQGAWSVLDFTGVQLAWAFSELTRSGAWIFHVLAVLPLPALVYLVTKSRGRVWGFWAGLIFVFSPMAFALSYTSHAHVLSRGFLALALACFYIPWRAQTRLHHVVGGLALCFALVCRPFEVIALGGPFVLLVTLPAARRDPAARRALLSMVGGVVLALVIMGVHNLGVSGNAFLSARFVENEYPHPYAWRFKPPWSPADLWNRFGANASYNTLMLSVWFLGIPGAVLSFIGVFPNRRTRALGLGVLAALAVALLHDDRGLHVVGPIHYSESAVLLTVLCVEGLRKVYLWLLVRRLEWKKPLAAALVVVPLTFGTFNVWHAHALHQQSLIHVFMYGLVEHNVVKRPAVLVAPRYYLAWAIIPPFAKRGSFVYEWRRPRPDLSEDILIAHDDPQALEPLRKAFPDRHFYRMGALDGPPWLRVTPLE